MIVVSDTTPIISLLKINCLNLLLIDEIQGRQVAARMGIKIMGTIGVLMAAYEEGIISKEEIKTAINILHNAGRHISERLYEQLMTMINA